MIKGSCQKLNLRKRNDLGKEYDSLKKNIEMLK